MTEKVRERADEPDDESDDEKDVATIRVGSAETTNIICHNCESCYFVEDIDDRWCPECYYSPRAAPPERSDDPWERFWQNRDRAVSNGERAYCVGGFIRPYIEDSDGIY